MTDQPFFSKTPSTTSDYQSGKSRTNTIEETLTNLRSMDNDAWNRAMAHHFSTTILCRTLPVAVYFTILWTISLISFPVYHNERNNCSAFYFFGAMFIILHTFQSMAILIFENRDELHICTFLRNFVVFTFSICMIGFIILLGLFIYTSNKSLTDECDDDDPFWLRVLTYVQMSHAFIFIVYNTLLYRRL